MTMHIAEILSAIPDALARRSEPEDALLIYTDDSRLFAVEGKEGRYYPGTLLTTLREAGYSVDIQLRPKLDEGLLERFQEVWFFLMSEENETLESAEVTALRAWMDRGGGVVITGDHASGDDRSALIGLGGAVGAMIPRARHLRVWDGVPGDSNGLESNDSTTKTPPNAGKDRSPQRLLIRQPLHHIFSGERHYFPDHEHEGKVLAPEMTGGHPTGEDHETWLAEWRPAGDVSGAMPPSPRVIAQGINWFRGELFDLMSAWDGDDVGVGRILADASWHHYVDYNLKAISGDERSSILATYCSQAFWLLPRARRARVLARALATVLESQTVVDYEHHHILSLGDDAKAILRSELPQAAYAELMAALRASAPLSAALLNDETFEGHWVGAQIKRLRRAVDNGQLLSLSTITDWVEPAEFLNSVLNSYEEELRSKMTEISALRERVGYE